MVLHAYTQTCCISSLSTRKATFSFFLRIVSAVIRKTTAFLAGQRQADFDYRCLNTSSPVCAVIWKRVKLKLFFFSQLDHFRHCIDITPILIAIKKFAITSICCRVFGIVIGTVIDTQVALLRFSRAFPTDSF